MKPLCKLVTAGDRDVLLVKRFDRKRTQAGYLRARMVSALTLLRADESTQARERWSYVLLAEELRRVSAEPRKDAQELFRRMCFNAMISNTDDHPRNHAVIATDKDWKLSPAYDLTPTPQVAKERRDLAMTCGDFGTFANRANLVSQSGRFLLGRDEADRILAQMEERVKSTWYKVARREGISERDCENINNAFVYPGFGLNVVPER
jgi:serine/threonine-protein kinase HipA